MKPERWQLVKEILEETLDAKEDQRAAFLAKRCAGDLDLRKEVEALLAADERASDFLTLTAVAQSGMLPRGEAIGPYRIVRLIGEGGMGEVYEAEQGKPVRRRVALKLVKLGMDTRQIVARFDADHPDAVFRVLADSTRGRKQAMRRCASRQTPRARRGARASSPT